MNPNASEKNAMLASLDLIRRADIRATSHTVKNLLWNHPDFPRLTSISDTLQDLHVKNISVRLSIEQLQTAPMPALGFMNVGGGVLATIISADENKVEWIDTTLGRQVDAIDSFRLKWSGITLLLERTEHSGEPEYTEKRRNEVLSSLRKPTAMVLGLVAVSCVVALAVIGGVDPSLVLPLLFSKICGTIVCSMLVWAGIDLSNPVLRKVCNLSGKSSCGSLLSSKSARLFGVFKWSEIGLIYFFGTLLTIVTAMLTSSISEVLPWIGALSVLAFPYAIYSVSYQAFIWKSWCVMCLVVQLLLLLELLFVISTPAPVFSHISYQVVGTFIIGFSISIASWLAFQSTLVKSIKFAGVSRSLEQMKFASNYLKSLMEMREPIPPFFNGMKVGGIGDIESDNVLTVVLTPKCRSCADMYEQVVKLKGRMDDLRVNFLFAAYNDIQDESGKIARNLLSLPVEEINGGLARWFAKQNMTAEQWIGENRRNISEIETGISQLDLHVRWSELAGITNTPFMIFNDIKLPPFYSVSDIEKLSRYLQPTGFDQIT